MFCFWGGKDTFLYNLCESYNIGEWVSCLLPIPSFFLKISMFSNVIINYPQVSVSKARAIIVLASDENADQVICITHYSFVMLSNSCQGTSSQSIFFFSQFSFSRVMHVL